MQFVGPPFIFKFQQIGSNCGLIAPHAAIDYDGRTVWKGKDNFYAIERSGLEVNYNKFVEKFKSNGLSKNKAYTDYSRISLENLILIKKLIVIITWIYKIPIFFIKYFLDV